MHETGHTKLGQGLLIMKEMDNGIAWFSCVQSAEYIIFPPFLFSVEQLIGCVNLNCD